MRLIIIASFVLALAFTLFTACNNTHTDHAHEQVAEGTQYICPMNCEKGKTYSQPGTCPVCRMDLEPVKAEVQANKAEYFTAMQSQPAQLEAGKSAMLSFTPKIRGNESAAVPLDLVHEKKMHLILVNDDLSWFDHLHPAYSASGSYDIQVLEAGKPYTNGSGHNEIRLDAGGTYWAFADFKPTGGLNQVNKVEVQVAGTPAKAVAYTQAKMSASVDGYTATMELGQDGLSTGSHQHLQLSIKQAGKAVDPATFENYLGEKAHLMLIEVQSKTFLHTHPLVEGGKLQVETTFDKPGTYRGWLQFQTGGKVHTADFVLVVTEGHGEHDGHEHEGHQH